MHVSQAVVGAALTVAPGGHGRAVEEPGQHVGVAVGGVTR